MISSTASSSSACRRARLAISCCSLAPALEAAGYGLDSDGRTRASALSGRKPLVELETTAGVFLIRRFTHGGLLRFLTRDRFADPERPFRELDVTAELARAGVPAPEVAAARARPAPVFGWRLEIVTRRIDGAADLAAILDRARSGGVDRRTVGRVATSFGRLVRAMHDAGCSHADLTTKNALVREDSLASRAPETLILDLDRARIDRVLAPAVRVANLARLYRYVLRAEGGTGRALARTDFARFLAAYEPDARERRKLARAVLSAEARGRALHALAFAFESAFGARGKAPTASPRSRILG